jgi:peroxiredoxin/outer membrane lipoprotein-sorting protein
MTRFALLILATAPAFAQPDPAAILANAQKAYAHLTAIHLAATQSQTFATSGGFVSSDLDYELAEKPPGRFRARIKGAVEAIAVSDGSTTWKALPASKQWMKLELAAASGDDNEDAEDAQDTRPKDLHDNVARAVLTRFPVIARLAQRPEILKEDTLKIDGHKAPCYILRAHIGPTQHDLWIDKDRYLVLRDLQSGPQASKDGVLTVTIDTKIKRLALDTDVPDTVFTFEPDRKWAQVDMLVLPGEERLMLTGRPAADFTLKALDGEPTQLSSLQGKVVVLDFWATWCPPCRAELPAIDKLHAEFAGKVEFLGVNDEDSGTVKGFLKKAGYTFPVLMDGKRQVHRTYGIRAIPVLLVIDRHGVIRQHFIGSRSEQALRSAIQSVLEQEP